MTLDLKFHRITLKTKQNKTKHRNSEVITLLLKNLKFNSH